MKNRTLFYFIPAYLLFLLLWGGGCAEPEPINPVLEDRLAHLKTVEQQTAGKKKLTGRERYELAMARTSVWEIYLARSRYGGSRWEEKAKADNYAKQAAAMFPSIENSLQALATTQTPPLATDAMVALNTIYARMPRKKSRQITVLETLLKKFGHLKLPRFGGHTPAFFAHHHLANIYQQECSQKYSAYDWDRMVHHRIQAIAALAAWGPDAQFKREKIIDRLLLAEPRIALPEYLDTFPREARLLIEKRLTTRDARVSISVDHIDHNGVVIAYEIVLPKRRPDPVGSDKPITGKELEKSLRWNMGSVKYFLGFTTFHIPRGSKTFNFPPASHNIIRSNVYNPELTFNEHQRCKGKVILPWKHSGPGPGAPFYLVATVKRKTILPKSSSGGFCVPDVCSVPLRVQCPDAK